MFVLLQRRTEIFLPWLSLSISDHAKARALLRYLALLYDREGQNESMIILSCSSRQSIYKVKSTEQVGEIQSSSSGLFTMQTLQNKTFLLKELLIILFSAASWFLTASRLCNFAFQTQIELRLWLSISNWFEIVSLYLRLNMIVTLNLRPDVSVERQWDPGEEWPLSPWPGPPPRQQERSRPSQRGKRAEVFLESRTEIFCLLPLNWHNQDAGDQSLLPGCDRISSRLGVTSCKSKLHKLLFQL